ncbi:MAG: hypothetical protein KDB27_08625 [Planctomycetales bacterium]|nr:hypothetical protein [Planctomycetales bacterium]
MTNVFENPVPILFVGVLIFGICFALWTQKRQRKFAAGMVLAILLMIGGVALERLVETESEKVGATIRQIAKDMEANDVNSVISHISGSSAELKSAATAILSRVKVESISVKRNLTVTVSPSGTKAVAKFNAVGRVEDKTATFGTQNVPRFMTLEFAKEQGVWRVFDYKDEMPQKGMGQ